MTFEAYIYIFDSYLHFLCLFSLIQLLALGFLALLEEKIKALEKIKSIADHREEDSQGGKVGNDSVRDSWRKQIPTFTRVGEKGK